MVCMTLNEKKITGPLSSASVGEGGVEVELWRNQKGRKVSLILSFTTTCRFENMKRPAWFSGSQRIRNLVGKSKAIRFHQVNFLASYHLA